MVLLPRFKRPKMLFIDFDGVLTPSMKMPGQPTPIPKLSYEAALRLKKLSETGFKLSIITTRPAEELIESNIFKMLKNVGFNDDGLFGNHKKRKLIVYGSRGMQRVDKVSRVEVDHRTGNIIRKPGLISGGSAHSETKLGVEAKEPLKVEKFLENKVNIEIFIKKFLKKNGIILKGLAATSASQPNVFFRFKRPDKTTLKKMKTALDKLVNYNLTKKNGLYKDDAIALKKIYDYKLTVKPYKDGLSIFPPEIGKHTGVQRSLATYKVPMEKKWNGFTIIKPAKIQGLAIGDSKEDVNMKTRQDIKFMKVDGIDDFIKKTENLSEKFKERRIRHTTSGLRWKLRKKAYKRKKGLLRKIYESDRKSRQKVRRKIK